MYQNNRSYGNYSNNNYRGVKQQNTRLEIETKPLLLPEDYVDQAESLMKRLIEQGNAPTTSKLRNIYAILMAVYDMEVARTEEQLMDESVHQLMKCRIRLVYEMGREKNAAAERKIVEFVEQTKILSYLKGIGKSRAEFIRFCHYMEALIAYHRFFGGRD